MALRRVAQVTGDVAVIETAAVVLPDLEDRALVELVRRTASATTPPTGRSPRRRRRAAASPAWGRSSPPSPELVAFNGLYYRAAVHAWKQVRKRGLRNSRGNEYGRLVSSMSSSRGACHPLTDHHGQVLAAVKRAASAFMPARGKGRLLKLSRTLSFTRHPPFPYPADVADTEALKAFLSDTDAFRTALAEHGAYLTDSLERFRVTMALLPKDLSPQSRILELGASPYFFTRLLRRRGLQVTCANFFDHAGPKAAVEVLHTSSGPETISFDHFNVETDEFPYSDGSFDLVLCCEILEHLPADPVHMLAEIHRVLRPDVGTLVLTTPNAARSDLLMQLVRGKNVYEALSGHGVYGRHNRVYTIAELRDLLVACNFDVEEAAAVDIHRHVLEHLRLPIMASRRNRGCNLFAVAHPRDTPRRPRPEWLFSSLGPRDA
ncbi:MAG: hypothetical protein QOK29_3060 [Rhodospirillaceae bacterium]|nr:hypothetical protein [Rhodospirillaceae bacterium]